MTIEDTTLNPNLETTEIVDNSETVLVSEVPVAQSNAESEIVSSSDNNPEMVAAPLETATKMEAFSTSSEEFKKQVVQTDSHAEQIADTNSSEFDELFEQLKKIKENNETIDVIVQERIRGGLRVVYNNMPLFLPSSHFSLKRSPSEDSLNSSLGHTFAVHIHELQEDETKRKTVIVSRKHKLEEEFWNSIKVGDIVEGNVTSIATFGIFIDLGGAEGLIHVSRLSNSHVEDTKSFAKKGQTLKAVVVEVNRNKKRIALSMKEFEESPWTNIADKYPNGSIVKGIVRRFTEFGAYVELSPGIDGLLRTSELSWTRRLQRPADLLTIGQEIEVEVLNSNAEKRTVALSYKKTTPNPWEQLKEKYAVGTELMGTIAQIVQQGCVVNIDGEIDGFMPRSKMKAVLKGNKIPYSNGDQVPVLVADLSTDTQSLILAPQVSEEQEQENERDNRRRGGDRPRREGDRDRDRDRKPSQAKQSVDASGNEGFNFADLLSESSKKSLLNKS